MKVNAQSQIKYLEELKDLMEFHVPGKLTQIYPQFANLELPGWSDGFSHLCFLMVLTMGFGMRRRFRLNLCSQAIQNPLGWCQTGHSTWSQWTWKLCSAWMRWLCLNLDATYWFLPETVWQCSGHWTSVQDHVQVQVFWIRSTPRSNNPSYVTELVDTCKTLYKSTKGIFVPQKTMAEVLITDGIPDWCVGWYGKRHRGSNKWQGVEGCGHCGAIHLRTWMLWRRDIIVWKMQVWK